MLEQNLFKTFPEIINMLNPHSGEAVDIDSVVQGIKVLRQYLKKYNLKAVPAYKDKEDRSDEILLGINICNDEDIQQPWEAPPVADSEEKNRAKLLIQRIVDEVLVTNSIKNNIKELVEKIIGKYDARSLLDDYEKHILLSFVKFICNDIPPSTEKLDRYLSGDVAVIKPYAEAEIRFFSILRDDALVKELREYNQAINPLMETESQKNSIIDKFCPEESIDHKERIALLRICKAAELDIQKLENSTYVVTLTGKAKKLYEKIKSSGKIKAIKAMQKHYCDMQSSVNEYVKFLLSISPMTIISNALNSHLVEDLSIAIQFCFLAGQNPSREQLRQTSNTNDIVERMIFEKEPLIKFTLEDIKQLGITPWVYEINQTNLQTKPYGSADPESLLDNNYRYNLLYLEDGHVLAISRLLAAKFNDGGAAPDNFYVINTPNRRLHDNKGQKEKCFRAAILNLIQGKPSQLFVSNGSHWTTCSILPAPDNKFFIVGMDSLRGCNDIETIASEFIEFASPVGMTPIVPSGRKFFNMSVSGQQHGGCCGFAAACNGFSLNKTFTDLRGNITTPDGSFHLEIFKNTLMSNIVYRSDSVNVENGGVFTGTILYGNRLSNVSLRDFVSILGSIMLRKVVSYEAITQALPGSNASEDDSVRHIMEDFDNDRLYDLLNDERKKALFIKILRHYSSNSCHWKDFAKEYDKLKYFVRINPQLESKLKEVVTTALGDSNSQPDLGIFDAIIMYLYHLPLFSHIIDLVDQYLVSSNIVGITREVYNVNKKCEGWKQYLELHDTTHTLISGF